MKSLSKKKPILLAGYLGGPNIGDESLALATLKRLSREHKKNEIIVLSGQPSISKKILQEGSIKIIKGLYPGKAISFVQFYNLVTTIFSSEKIIFVGGGIVQDVHSLNLLTQSLFYSMLARLFSVPAIGIGIGIGPIKSEKGKKIATQFINYLTFLILRDYDSLLYMNTLDLQARENVTIGVDTAFSLSVPKSNHHFGGGIGICLRKWPTLSSKSVVELIDIFRTKDIKLTFLSFEKADSVFYKSLNISDKDIIFPDSVNMALEIISELDGMISMRLHGNIFSLLCNTPFVAISYDPKVTNVLTQAGYEKQIIDINFEPIELVSKLNAFKTIHSYSLDEIKQKSCLMVKKATQIKEVHSLELKEKLIIITSLLKIIFDKILIPNLRYYKTKMINFILSK